MQAKVCVVFIFKKMYESHPAYIQIVSAIKHCSLKRNPKLQHCVLNTDISA